MRPANETPANTFAGILVRPMTRLTIGKGTSGTRRKEKRYQAPSSPKPLCISASWAENLFFTNGPNAYLESANGNIAPIIVVGKEARIAGTKPSTAAPAMVTMPGGGNPITAEAKRIAVNPSVASTGLDAVKERVCSRLLKIKFIAVSGSVPTFIVSAKNAQTKQNKINSRPNNLRNVQILAKSIFTALNSIGQAAVPGH